MTETTKGIVPLATLTTIAADRRAFGDDVLAAFRSQIEQRSTQAQAVLDAATTAGRDTLLASEQRSYDGGHPRTRRDSRIAATRRTAHRAARACAGDADGDRDAPDRDRGPVAGADARAALQRVSDEARRLHLPRRAWRRVDALRRDRPGAGARRPARTERGGAPGARRRHRQSRAAIPYRKSSAAQFIDRVQKRRACDAGRRADGADDVGCPAPGPTRAAGCPYGIGSPSGSAANWKAENEAINEGILTLERVTFTARTLPMLIKLSVELSGRQQQHRRDH